MISKEPASTVTATTMERVSTKRALKMDSIISVLLTSIIGPNTRKASKEPGEKDLAKEAATKASVVEHRESR